MLILAYNLILTSLVGNKIFECIGDLNNIKIKNKRTAFMFIILILLFIYFEYKIINAEEIIILFFINLFC